MFDNAGGQIKIWAKIITWIGIVVSVVAGILMISGSSMMGYYYSYRNAMIWPGLLTMALGSLLSWVNGLFIYNFGNIAEQTEATRNEIATMAADQHAQLELLLKALEKPANE